MFEQEIRPTPAALIDKEFVGKIEAFFQKETEFNERLEQLQRVADRTCTVRCKQKGRKDSRAPAEWQKIAEGVFGRSP